MSIQFENSGRKSFFLLLAHHLHNAQHLSAQHIHNENTFNFNFLVSSLPSISTTRPSEAIFSPARPGSRFYLTFTKDFFHPYVNSRRHSFCHRRTYIRESESLNSLCLRPTYLRESDNRHSLYLSLTYLRESESLHLLCHRQDSENRHSLCHRRAYLRESESRR